MNDVEAEIESFVAKYTPAMAAQLRDARQRARALFPRGFELVYDNYNAYVFGFGVTERASDVLVSIAGYPRWMTLFFLKGAALADPHHLLEGSGSQVRSIRLSSSKDLERPEVLSMIAQALAPSRTAYATAPALRTVVKSVSEKQRSRRPAVHKLPA
jgi:hypothetical protein